MDRYEAGKVMDNLKVSLQLWWGNMLDNWVVDMAVDRME